jgi:peptide/nickel transport system substrate-binding protein
MGIATTAGAAILAACGGGSTATNTPAAKPTTAAAPSPPAAIAGGAAPSAPAAISATSAPPPIATTASASSAAPVGTTGAAPAGTTSAATPSPAASSAAASLPGKRGGKIVWALDLAPTVLIPYGLISFDIVQGHEFIYDSLLEWDKDLNVKPALAESFEATNDRTYIFHLRKGVKFHDGQEMTAEDVKYSMDTQVNPPLPGQKGFGLVIASADIIDKYTVKITMPSANPTVPGFMARGNAPIIPKGVFDRLNLSNQAIGTGPYKLAEFVPNDRVVLTRNPDFWKPGLPYIDEITLKGFPDEQSRIAALRAGAIDGGNFTTDTVQSNKNDKSFVLQKGLTSNPHLIHFTIKGDGKPWNDVRVRQAINKVVNRQDLIDKIYNGDAEVTGVVASGFGDWPLSKDDLLNKYYRQDLAGAKKLMADAGFAQGFPVTLQTHATQQDLRQAAEIIAEQVKVLGINASIKPVEGGQYVKVFGDGSYEWASNGRGVREDVSQYLNDYYPGLGLYDAQFKGGWKSDELIKMFDDGFATADPAKRKPIYQRMQQIIAEEVPNLYTVNPFKFQLVRNRVKNMYVSYTNMNPGLREAWVEG